MFLYMLAILLDGPAQAEPPAVLPLPSTPAHNYLHPPLIDCEKAHNVEEIVVCGSKDSPYRLKPIDDHKYDDLPIRAETKFAGGVLGITGQQADVGGFRSNRVMLTFKIKF